MNSIIARVKSKEHDESSKYKKLLSDNNIDEPIFQIKKDVTYIPYNPSTLISENELYEISNFSKQPYCLDFLKEPFNSAYYLNFNVNDFGKLDFLCSYQNDNEYHFQRITKSQLITKPKLSFSRECKFSKNEKSIYIKKYADAVYLKNEDKLIFRSLSSITGIFKGIDELYREATNEETTEFLSNDLICLVGNYNFKSVKTQNRKRIALATDTLNKFNERDKSKIFLYIKEYCPELKIAENMEAFCIGSEEELKQFLCGIQQQYYTKPIDNVKVLANSTISLEK